MPIRMIRAMVAGLLLGVTAASAILLVSGEAGAQQSFQTSAGQAVLMDYDTGTILLEKEADTLMAPASLAKVMTAEVVFNELREGRLRLDSEFTISENAWRRGGASAGGSTMFAVLNSKVRVDDLIRGLVVQSGNDAAIALAEGIAGTEEAFAQMMTKRARALGLEKSTFRNSWGKGDPGQQTTAREMARLTAHVIATYPEYYHYFGETEFTWNKIRQTNRNPLLNMDIGADGLKTGNIEESGFGLIGSAVQGGQRLILVLNGARNARERADEARKILLWGFRAFENRTLFDENEIVGTASVFGGVKGSVGLVAENPVKVLVPRGSSERLTGRIYYVGPLMAPVEAGKRVARLKLMRGNVEALDIPLMTGESVEQGSLTDRAFDAGLELAGGWIRKAFQKE